MSRLGQFLCARGLLSDDQLREALDHQAIYGARLGTNLIELHYITPEKLAESLSALHRVPLPPRTWLERPGKAAIKRVTRPLVERIRFIPLRYLDKVLHVAVLDPNDPGVLDNLRFATGCRIKPYVLPEVWMHGWLFSLFQIPRGIRHIEADGEHAAQPATVSQQPPAFDLHAMQAAQQAQAQHVRAASGPAAAAFDASSMRSQSQRVNTSLGMAFAHAQAVTQPISRDTHDDLGDMAEVESETRKLESVRPPQFTVRSLADLETGASLRSPANSFSIPARPSDPDARSLWEPPPRDPRWPPAHDEPKAELIPEPDDAPTAELIPIPDDEEEPQLTLEPEAPASVKSEPSLSLPYVPSIAPRPKVSESSALRLSKLERAMMEVTHRERLIELSFQLASQYATKVALFLVQQGMIEGLRCADHGGAPRALEGVLVPVASNSMLSNVSDACKPMRCAPDERPIDVRVRESLGDEAAREVALFPVLIKQRVVNVLYASNGGDPIGSVAFAALTALAERMGAAYEQIIRNRKQSYD